MSYELSLIERLRLCFNSQSADIRDLCSEAADELECITQQRDDFERDVNQWLFMLAECKDEINELEAKLAAVTAERDALAGQVEDLEWENKGIDEWRSLYVQSQEQRRAAKLDQQQIEYLMEERAQDIEQIAQLTVALNQALKFVNEICTTGGAYGYHQGALVADARQLMGQLEKAKGS